MVPLYGTCLWELRRKLRPSDFWRPFPFCLVFPALLLVEESFSKAAVKAVSMCRR